MFGFSFFFFLFLFETILFPWHLICDHWSEVPFLSSIINKSLTILKSILTSYLEC
jgi:hypothetical protein